MRCAVEPQQGATEQTTAVSAKRRARCSVGGRSRAGLKIRDTNPISRSPTCKGRGIYLLETRIFPAVFSPMLILLLTIKDL
jgi:hypothetical protein